MPTDTPPDRPRSRLPSSYPPEILRAITFAIKSELCIPFQSIALARQFKRTLADIRRSFREHKHADWLSVNSLTLTEHTTVDVMSQRPTYECDCIRYPVTCILSCASGFMENLSLAQNTQTGQSPDLHPTQLPSEAFEAEVLALLSLSNPEDSDDTEELVHSIFRRS